MPRLNFSTLHYMSELHVHTIPFHQWRGCITSTVTFTDASFIRSHSVQATRSNRPPGTSGSLTPIPHGYLHWFFFFKSVQQYGGLPSSYHCVFMTTFWPYSIYCTLNTIHILNTFIHPLRQCSTNHWIISIAKQSSGLVNHWSLLQGVGVVSLKCRFQHCSKISLRKA